MKLALVCGRADVDQFLSEMPSKQLTEWLAFERLDGPIGSWRDDWRMGMITSTLANIHRDVKKKAKAYLSTEFIPKWGEPVVELTDEEKAIRQQGIFKGLAEYYRSKRKGSSSK